MRRNLVKLLLLRDEVHLLRLLRHALRLHLAELQGHLGGMEHLLGQIEALLLMLRYREQYIRIRASRTLGLARPIDLKSYSH